MNKGCLAVDFDGVLHSYVSPWVDATVIPDPPVDGAIAWLVEMSEKFDVVIHTTRAKTPAGCEAVRAWLDANGFPAAWHARLAVSAHKPPALAYLDDRAIRFEGPGTFPTAEDIYGAKPWNKRGRPDASDTPFDRPRMQQIGRSSRDC